MKTLIDQSNTTAVFVYLPGYLEVSDDLWNLAEADYDGAAVRSLPHDTLVAAAKRIGFKHVIDPYIDNAGECMDQNLYHPLDMHLNAEGSACVANLISDRLATLLVTK